MNCPSCDKKLKVTNVISLGCSKTLAAECRSCDKRFTFVTLLVTEIRSRGDGPHALAKRLRAGESPRDVLPET